MHSNFKNVLRFCILALFNSVYTSSQTLDDTIDLYRHITHGYQKEVFPVKNQSKGMDIYFQVFPMLINSFSEIDETISMTMSIGFIWHDPKLTWSPKNFGGKSNITISSKDIWLPDVYLKNTVDNLKPFGAESQFYVTITNTGIVYWPPGDILKSKCPTNILKFPFDSQKCRYTFGMWGVSKDVAEIIPSSENANFSLYLPHPDWEVTTQRQFAYEYVQASALDFELSIKRRPFYYVVSVILPTLMFSLMNPLVFLLPIESGERVSLGMTILLSYTIFFTLVSDSVPATSNPVCALLLVIIIIVLLSGCIVICLIISVHCYYVDDIKSVHPGLQCLGQLCKFKTSSNQIQKEQEKNETPITGKDVSKMLDKIFLIVSYIILVVTLSAYFILVFVF